MYLRVFAAAALTAAVTAAATSPPLFEPVFEEVSEAVGASWAHDFDIDYADPAELTTPQQMAGGVASGDFDRDGDVDLYLITGSASPNVLLVNDGQGQFADQAVAAGVALAGEENTAPVFVDFDGDGWLDLLVGGLEGTGLRVFRNRGDGRFDDVTNSVAPPREDDFLHDASLGFGDLDGDGDLDLFAGHWGAITEANHLWVNTGRGGFIAADEKAGITDIYEAFDWTFAPTFADIDGDGRQDLLITSDFGTSHVLRNLDGLRLENITTDVIDVDSGMGSAVFDYDNDGDLDWFVTAIDWAGDREGEGNRLYENDGNGQFSDVTEAAGLLAGGWGWSVCAADFDNNGFQDLFHVNGMPWKTNVDDFYEDLSRLFLNQGDGTFVERSLALGIEDEGQGRGVACFDADNDGDIDIFAANAFGLSRFWRNDLPQGAGWLQVSLGGEPNNPFAVGARIELTVNGQTQMREIAVGSHYQSQSPLQQHFGLNGAEQVETLRVSWPHGGETVLTGIAANQRLTLSAADALPAPFFIRPGTSAAWYEPATAGEGFILEVIDHRNVVLYWFTYDTVGEQDWYIAAGVIDGRRIHFDKVLQVSGGEFGPGFDPLNVSETVVGRASFTFTGCGGGLLDWQVGDKTGRKTLSRLTQVQGLDCGEAPAETGPHQHLSGSWFDPNRSGEGFTLEVIGESQAVVWWFSYDTKGARRWFLGAGNIEDGVVRFDNLLTTHGGIFGRAFSPEDVDELPWGRLELELGCDMGEARYEASEAGFGSGSLQLARLTRYQDLDCP